MSTRRSLPKSAEAEVLIRSLRHCCLCYFHERIQSVRRGQIAHLNRDHNDHAADNLVWLCLDHHAEYDSRPSQSKGWKISEVRHWRDQMYSYLEQLHRTPVPPSENDPPPADAAAPRAPNDERDKGDRNGRMWRFPLWQIADRPEFFAYLSGNRADGVCVIERIDLPDGRIVVACIQVPGNPGNSITNTVETICEQVCARFEIPLDRLVWLENYEYIEPKEWKLVTFGEVTSEGRLEDPTWKEMAQDDWDKLQLRPRTRLDSSYGDLTSKIEKLFPWPPADYMLG